MTYIWQIPDDHPEEMIAEYDRKRSPDRFLFRMAQPLPADVGPAYLSIKREMTEVLSWDCIPNTTMLPLVNPDLAHLLTEHAGKDMWAGQTRRRDINRNHHRLQALESARISSGR